MTGISNGDSSVFGDRVTSSAPLKIATAIMAFVPLGNAQDLAGQEKEPVPATTQNIKVSESLSAEFYCVDRSGGTNQISQVSGQVLKANDTGFFFLDDKRSEQFLPHSDILRISLIPNPFKPVNIAKTESVSVALTDGSRFTARDVSFSFSDRSLTIVRDSGTCTAPHRGVQFVRFSTNNQFDAHWQDIVDRQKDTVTQVVVKRERSLDYLAAAVEEIDATSVSLNVDGQEIKAARGKKIEGIVFRTAGNGKTATPEVCSVKGSFGIVHASETRFSETGTISITTPAGMKITIPFSELREIDYSPCKAESLSALKVVATKFNPLAAFDTPEAQLNAMMSAQITPVVQTPVTYEGKKYTDTLTIAPGTSIEVYTREGYDRLIGFIAVNENISEGTSSVIVRNGETVLLEKEFSAVPEAVTAGKYNFFAGGFLGTREKPTIVPPQRSDKVPLDLDISTARKLTIEVSGDIPVTLFDAKALKKPSN